MTLQTNILFVIISKTVLFFPHFLVMYSSSRHRSKEYCSDTSSQNSSNNSRIEITCVLFDAQMNETEIDVNATINAKKIFPFFY